MVSAEDYSIEDMMKVDSKEINFRINYDKYKANHYYTRSDYKSVAQAVNIEIKKNDIVITTIFPVSPMVIMRWDSPKIWVG